MDVEENLVIGGGISGLATAYFLKEKGEKVTVLEATDRLGGWIGKIEDAPFPFPLGPRTVRWSEGSALSKLIKSLELKPHPSPKGLSRYIYWNGELHPLKLSSPLLKGVRRDLFWGLLRTPSLKDQSAASFFKNHFSEKVAQRIGIPFLRGVFGQEGEELSFQEAFPWVKRKPLLFQLFGKKSQFLSLPGGISSLVDKLSEKLEGNIFLNQKVVSMAHHEAGVEVTTQHGVKLARRVFSTLPLPSIPHQSITSLHFYWEQKIEKIQGFGYLVSPEEKGAVLGAVFDSELLEGSKGTAITLMLAGHILKEEALEMGKEAIKKHLNIDRLPDWMRVTYAKDAIPSYPINYPETKKTILKEFKSSIPELVLLGTSFCGISLSQLVEGAMKWKP